MRGRDKNLYAIFIEILTDMFVKNRMIFEYKNGEIIPLTVNKAIVIATQANAILFNSLSSKNLKNLKFGKLLFVRRKVVNESASTPIKSRKLRKLCAMIARTIFLFS